jgi:hypothetical protein
LAYDGNHIIVVDRANCLFIWISPENGTVIKKIPIPLCNPESESGGLECSGKYLWHSNGTKSIIYLIDPLSGRILKKIKLLPCHPHDLAIHNDSIYVAVRNLKCIYEVKVK